MTRSLERAHLGEVPDIVRGCRASARLRISSPERIRLRTAISKQPQYKGSGWVLVCLPVFKTGVTPKSVRWVRFLHIPARPVIG